MYQRFLSVSVCVCVCARARACVCVCMSVSVHWRSLSLHARCCASLNNTFASRKDAFRLFLTLLRLTLSQSDSAHSYCIANLQADKYKRRRGENERRVLYGKHRKMSRHLSLHVFHVYTCRFLMPKECSRYEYCVLAPISLFTPLAGVDMRSRS